MNRTALLRRSNFCSQLRPQSRRRRCLQTEGRRQVPLRAHLPDAPTAQRHTTAAAPGHTTKASPMGTNSLKDEVNPGLLEFGLFRTSSTSSQPTRPSSVVVPTSPFLLAVPNHPKSLSARNSKSMKKRSTRRSFNGSECVICH